MGIETQEIVTLGESLPQERRGAVLEFVRSLSAQGNTGDDAWDRIINHQEPRPRLDFFLEESAKEKADKLDLDKL